MFYSFAFPICRSRAQDESGDSPFRTARHQIIVAEILEAWFADPEVRHRQLNRLTQHGVEGLFARGARRSFLAGVCYLFTLFVSHLFWTMRLNTYTL